MRIGSALTITFMIKLLECARLRRVLKCLLFMRLRGEEREEVVEEVEEEEGEGDRHQMRRASDRTKDPPTQTVLNMENIFLLNSAEHNLMLNLTRVF